MGIVHRFHRSFEVSSYAVEIKLIFRLKNGVNNEASFEDFL